MVRSVRLSSDCGHTANIAARQFSVGGGYRDSLFTTANWAKLFIKIAAEEKARTVNISDVVAEALLAGRADAIIAADRDGIIRFWNPGAERLFGFTRQEALEQSLNLIIPERLRQRHWDGYNHVIQTGHSRYADGDLLSVPAIRKDGSTISVQFTVTPIKDETGKLIGMAAVMRDVTKQFQEMRALKRKLDECGA